MTQKIYLAVSLSLVTVLGQTQTRIEPHWSYNTTIVTHPITQETTTQVVGGYYVQEPRQEPWEPVGNHLDIRPSKTLPTAKAETSLVKDASSGRMFGGWGASFGLYQSRPVRPNRYRGHPRHPRHRQPQRGRHRNPFAQSRQGQHTPEPRRDHKIEPSRASRKQDEADDRQLFVPGSAPGLPPGQLVPIGVPANPLPPVTSTFNLVSKLRTILRSPIK